MVVSVKQKSSYICIIMDFLDVPTGGKKFIYNGYYYTKKAVKQNRIRWECTERRGRECKGAVTTSLQVRYMRYCVRD